MVLPSLRQGASVDFQHLHLIGVVDFLKGRSIMPLLPTRLSIALSLSAGLLTVRVCGGRFAAVLAIECNPIEQQGHQQEQDFQCGLERRR